MNLKDIVKLLQNGKLEEFKLCRTEDSGIIGLAVQKGRKTGIIFVSILEIFKNMECDVIAHALEKVFSRLSDPETRDQSMRRNFECSFGENFHSGPLGEAHQVEKTDEKGPDLRLETDPRSLQGREQHAVNLYEQGKARIQEANRKEQEEAKIKELRDKDLQPIIDEKNEPPTEEQEAYLQENEHDIARQKDEYNRTQEINEQEDVPGPEGSR